MDTGVAPGLHGYTSEEQARLYHQARILEHSVYEKVDFSRSHRLLEVGCGVGAQTEILLERFPQLNITGVDAAQEQIKKAREYLAEPVAKGRVALHAGDALHLPFSSNSFDSAFICWLLEHVQNPVGILKEVRRVLQPEAVIYCSEVLNATFYVHPYSPNTLKYWFAFNDHQWSLKGDPFVGAKLANYLLAAGFQNVATDTRVYHFDNRAPKRREEFIDYWTSLLLSGAAGLIQAGKVDKETVDGMRAELETLKNAPDSVIFYSWIQARAQAF